MQDKHALTHTLQIYFFGNNLNIKKLINKADGFHIHFKI